MAASYLEGRGAEQNFEEAMVWFERAAEAGSERAASIVEFATWIGDR